MVTVRSARHDDSESLWRWRNDATSRAASLEEDPVPWEVHQAWFARSLRSTERTILIALDESGRRVGMVRFDDEPDDTATVSINIAPERRGAGFGRLVLAAALDHYAAAHPDRRLRAIIRESNAASLRLFEGQGFRLEGSDDGVMRLSRNPSLSSATPS